MCIHDRIIVVVIQQRQSHRASSVRDREEGRARNSIFFQRIAQHDGKVEDRNMQLCHDDGSKRENVMKKILNFLGTELEVYGKVPLELQNCNDLFIQEIVAKFWICHVK